MNINKSSNNDSTCTLFSSQEVHVYGENERKRFDSYVRELKKETDIKEIWRWYDNDFFPFDLDFYVNAMEEYFPNRVEEFSKCCDMLQAPAILKEIFAYMRKKYGDDILFDFMSKTSVCAQVNEKKELVWDNNCFAAPIMLDFLLDALLNDYPIGTKVDEEKISEFTKKIGEILLEREDGYFLIWNYVKYLLSRSVKNQEVLYIFIDEISNVCRPLLEDYYGNKNWIESLIPKGFTLQCNRDKFAQTGLLGVTGKESLYMNIVTQMLFYEKKRLFDYITAFEDSILLEDDNFKAFSPRPLLCHYYISDAYLANEDPILAWQNTWKMMAPARYRMWFNRYDEVTNGISRNVNFVLIVGIAMAEQLYSTQTRDDLEKGLDICTLLLNILDNSMCMAGGKESQLHNEMLEYLITWKFLFYKAVENDSVAFDETIDHILNHCYHPRQMLIMLLKLEKNGFNPKLHATDGRADNFYNKVMWAADYAIAQENCEYKLAELGRHAKNWIARLRR